MRMPRATSADVQRGVRAPIEPAGRAAHRRAHLTGQDAAMLGLLILLVVCHSAAAIIAVGWRTAALTDLLGTTYLALVLALRPVGRPILARLMLLGLVAGVCELATDAAGEQVVHSLSYPPGEPLLWRSPMYMPVSWMLVVSLLAYLGWRLWQLTPRLPLTLAVALTGLAGAFVVPFFEETASYAGWWHYAPARLMLGYTPAYVLLFEAMIAALLPLLTANLRALGGRAVVLRSVALGAWMPVAALVAWVALGRW